MPPKLSFLDMPAPAGYVPGLGRGATGFSTRADLGSALRSTADASDLPDEPDRFRDADDAGILGRENADADDEMADQIYAAIDARMEERNAKRREIREEKERVEEAEQATIGKMFADAKRALSQVSHDEWLNLPESGDQTRKNKRARMEAREGLRSYNISDTVLEGLRGRAELSQHVNEAEEEPQVTHIKAISSARDKILDLKLSGTETSTSVDPTGYITSLNSQSGFSTSELADIKKMTPFVESLIRSNPRNAAGWIAAVRLAELRKKPSQAIQLAAQGCENCPKHEEVWLEAIRVNTVVNARIIASKAVQRLPESVPIWQAAADLETDEAKKRVLRKALIAVPQSVELWKQLVNMENEDHARLLLRQAVESVPLSVDLWLALARLEDHKTAEKVLNKARKAVRTAPEIWIAAARLREQVNGQAREVDKIIKKGVAELSDHGRVLSRDEWLAQAHICESEDAPLACAAIVKATAAGEGLQNEPDYIQVDAFLECTRDTKYPITARAVFQLATEMLPNSERLWVAWASLERRLQSENHLEDTLEKAVSNCPTSVTLWLTYIKEKWHKGKFKDARQIVSRAFEHVGDSEKIWLEAVQLELEVGQPDRARDLLKKSRDEDVAGPSLWIRAVLLERQLQQPSKAVELADQGLELFPECDGLWIQKGQAEIDIPGSLPNETFLQGTKNCPKSVKLWILLAQSEESRGIQIRARSVLEQAALINPKNEELWLSRVRLELRAGNLPQVKVLLARALQECPSSGRLLSESIAMEPRTHRKSKLVDAVSKNQSDGYILVLLARSLWQRNQFDKASKWFTTALEADPQNGDSWLWAFKFYSERGEGIQEVIDGFKQTEPTNGEVWIKMKEDISNFGKSEEEILKEGSEKLKLDATSHNAP